MTQGDKDLRLLVDSTPAAISPVAGVLARYPIKSRNGIAHIRKATQGRVSLENCRLFVRESAVAIVALLRSRELRNRASPHDILHYLYSTLHNKILQ
jgi:glutamine phosphoribosylpyrophosphate amidotransferase